MNNESNVSTCPANADNSGVALNSDRDERYARLVLEGMAECMDMVRQELIDDGIIPASTPPMMVGSAVIKLVNELRLSAGAAAHSDTAQTQPKTNQHDISDDCRDPQEILEQWFSDLGLDLSIRDATRLVQSMTQSIEIRMAKKSLGN